MTCVDLHRHGRRVHRHPYAAPHRHIAGPLARSTAVPHGSPHDDHDHDHHDLHDHHDHHGHHDLHGVRRRTSHSHGIVDPSVTRSRAGVLAVGLSLAVLGATAIAQTVVFALSGSVALLADLIHNAGDALTAIPLTVAFAMRSPTAERRAGLFVVAAIFASAIVAGVESIRRLISPAPPTHLAALAVAGAIGFIGNAGAARIRLRAGRRLDSAALVADGEHARADAYVSAAVIVSALVVAAGHPIIDPIIGLGIALVIVRITTQSWRTVRGHAHR